METYYLEADITVVCVPATSFPAGVAAAHQQLHAMIPYSADRKYFGISYEDANQHIIYKAAAEAFSEVEIQQWGLETFVLKKGAYINISIYNYMNDIPAIGQAFRQILADSRIDPTGACVEWYLNDKDMRCMVRLAD